MHILPGSVVRSTPVLATRTKTPTARFSGIVTDPRQEEAITLLAKEASLWWANQLRDRLSDPPLQFKNEVTADGKKHRLPSKLQPRAATAEQKVRHFQAILNKQLQVALQAAEPQGSLMLSASDPLLQDALCKAGIVNRRSKLPGGMLDDNARLTICGGKIHCDFGFGTDKLKVYVLPKALRTYSLNNQDRSVRTQADGDRMPSLKIGKPHVFRQLGKTVQWVGQTFRRWKAAIFRYWELRRENNNLQRFDQLSL